MGCFYSKKPRHAPGYEEPTVLAAKHPFSNLPQTLQHGHTVTVSEVESLYQLFKKVSSSIIDDGLIHEEEFKFALFRNKNQRNLFVDRIFDLFDVKRNRVIELGEFVRSLSVFHSNAPLSEKIAFAFRLYDLRDTGIYRERRGRYSKLSQYLNIAKYMLKEMVLAILHESDLVLSDDVVKTIMDKTFNDADTKSDGKIDQEEWKEFISKNPSLIKNMTLPYLKDITLAFPSFVMMSEADDSEM